MAYIKLLWFWVILVSLCNSKVEYRNEIEITQNPIRKLDTDGSSYTTCSSCQNQNGGAYFNATCDTDPYRDIFDNYSPMSNLGDYGYNGEYLRVLTYSDYNDNLVMYQNYTSSDDFNNLGVWSINLSTYRNVVLRFSRSNFNYEEIGIEYYNAYGKYYLQ